jgi:hypothetical protein
MHGSLYILRWRLHYKRQCDDQMSVLPIQHLRSVDGEANLDMSYSHDWRSLSTILGTVVFNMRSVLIRLPPSTGAQEIFLCINDVHVHTRFSASEVQNIQATKITPIM